LGVRGFSLLEACFECLSACEDLGTGGFFVAVAAADVGFGDVDEVFGADGGYLHLTP
jgi:hypothetical protein